MLTQLFTHWDDDGVARGELETEFSWSANKTFLPLTKNKEIVTNFNSIEFWRVLYGCPFLPLLFNVPAKWGALPLSKLYSRLSTYILYMPPSPLFPLYSIGQVVIKPFVRNEWNGWIQKMPNQAYDRRARLQLSNEMKGRGRECNGMWQQSGSYFNWKEARRGHTLGAAVKVSLAKHLSRKKLKRKSEMEKLNSRWQSQEKKYLNVTRSKQQPNINDENILNNWTGLRSMR